MVTYPHQSQTDLVNTFKEFDWPSSKHSLNKELLQSCPQELDTQFL